MQYTIRVALLMGLMGLSVISNNLRNTMDSQLSLQSIGFFVINCLFILVMIYGYGLSKTITRHLGRVIFETIVLIALIFISFLPQIDSVFYHFITQQYPWTLENSLFVNYIQFVTIYWMTTYVIIFRNRNRNQRRNNASSSVRYMRS